MEWAASNVVVASFFEWDMLVNQADDINFTNDIDNELFWNNCLWHQNLSHMMYR